MNASPAVPANTMSRGSSPTSSVRVTCGVPVSVTMLTLSDRWLTTQTSELVRAATATGSRPTGTRAANVIPLAVTLKISRVAFGVFTANRCVPSGDSAIGRTGPLSNSTNDGDVTAADWVCRSPGCSELHDVAHRRLAPAVDRIPRTDRAFWCMTDLREGVRAPLSGVLHIAAVETSQRTRS